MGSVACFGVAIHANALIYIGNKNLRLFGVFLLRSQSFPGGGLLFQLRKLTLKHPDYLTKLLVFGNFGAPRMLTSRRFSRKPGCRRRGRRQRIFA